MGMRTNKYACCFWLNVLRAAGHRCVQYFCVRGALAAAAVAAGAAICKYEDLCILVGYNLAEEAEEAAFCRFWHNARQCTFVISGLIRTIRNTIGNTRYIRLKLFFSIRCKLISQLSKDLQII